MTPEQLDQIRLQDINFFAKRYTELFGKYFGVIDEKGAVEFEKSIRDELLVKCPKYEINPEICGGSRAKSKNDGIYFTNEDIANDFTNRIHELFHSYNTFDEIKGLKDFRNGSFDVLKQFDEGATEMFARKMTNNKDKDRNYYNDDVMITRFIECAVGEGDLIRATRGRPDLLTTRADEIFGKKGVCQDIEKTFDNASWHLNRFWEKYKIPEKFCESALHATAYIREFRNPILTNVLGEKVKNVSTREEAVELGQIISNMKDVCEHYDYKFYKNRVAEVSDFFRATCMEKFGEMIPDGKDVVADNGMQTEKTIADVQQEYLRSEIEALERQSHLDIRNMVKIEIKKQLHDNIEFVKSFEHKARGTLYSNYYMDESEKAQAERFRSPFGDERNLLKYTGIFATTISDIETAAFVPINIQAGYFALEKDNGGYLAARMNIDAEKVFIDRHGKDIYRSVCAKIGTHSDYFQGKGILSGLVEDIAAIEKHTIATAEMYKGRDISSVGNHGALVEAVLTNIQSSKTNPASVMQAIVQIRKLRAIPAHNTNGIVCKKIQEHFTPKV